MAQCKQSIQWARFYTLPSQVRKLIIRYIIDSNFNEAKRVYKLNMIE